MDALRADDAGLSIKGEGGAASLVAWSEIQALVGSKVDCIEYEELVLDRAFWHLRRLSEGIRAAGRYAFADDPRRPVKYLRKS